MKKNRINNSLAVIFVCILFISALSPFGFSKILQNKSDASNKISYVNFISRSSGLEIPSKEEGNTELELADINNDGNLDVISVGDHGCPYVNSPQHGIMVWFGDGKGNWSVSQVGNFGYGGIEAGDLNLDGYLDVVWGIHHDYSGIPGFGDTLIGAALGDGTGSNWIPWATGLGTAGEDWGMFETDLADFDCNGLLDLISQSFGCCNAYHVYRNNNNGTWTHKWSSTGGNTYNNLEIADFNSDGFLDFAGNRDVLHIYLGDGDFGFNLTQNGLPTSWNGLDCGDANNDGCDDIVIGYGSLGVRCYTFDKQNNDWDLESDDLPTSGTYYPQFGDINGDGFLDIIAYADPTGYVFLGDGNGNWVADATFSMPSPGEYSGFVVDGDFDHDGREDVVIQAAQGSWPSYQNQLKAFSPWLEPTELSARVSVPHGGETFRSGSIRNIRWLSAVPIDEGNSTVDIQISLNGDLGPWDTIVSDIPDNGCYQWLVNSGGSENCRIKVIVSTSSTSTYAISTSDFKIISFNVDAHGPYQGLVNNPIQFTGSAENGTSPYEYHWDFGDGGNSDEQNPTHVYNDSGNYTITLSVTDGDGITVIDSTWALIINGNPPTAPIIKGPENGKTGVEYIYTFNSTDFNNRDLTYIIQWGDGTEDVIGVFPSGTEASASHEWVKKGSYIIKSKARNDFGEFSDWGQLNVNIPRYKIISNSLSQWLQRQFIDSLKIIKFIFLKTT